MNSLFKRIILLILLDIVRLSLCQSKNIRQNNDKPSLKKIKMEIFYESLCPDSRRFIVNQLAPAHRRLGKHISVELIPFGKASFSEKINGGWNFDCQHGPKECLGNKYQACLLKSLSDKCDSLKLESVKCIMNDTEPQSATERCMKKLALEGYEDVDSCVNSIEGENLLHENGVKTLSLKPDVYFVPWIVYAGKWNKLAMESSLVNLEDYLKSKISEQVGRTDV